MASAAEPGRQATAALATRPPAIELRGISKSFGAVQANRDISIRVRPGDAIALVDKARKIPMVRECVEQPALSRPEWLSCDEKAFSARVTRLPEAGEVPFPVEVQHVVEYYAVRL